jgi:hypothetical protein
MSFHTRLAGSMLAGLLPLAAQAESLQLAPAGTFAAGATTAAEIVSFDPISQRLFVTNAAANRIDVLDASNVDAPTLAFSISTAPYGGSVNSVAVKNGIVAAAVENAVVTDPGVLVLFDTNGTHLRTISAGALPDQVSFSPDGRYALVANEGEPRTTIDPPGSVTVVDLANGVAQATSTTIDFSAYSGREEELRARGVRVFPNRSAGVDLEPEYIAVSPDSSQAFVTLQEANAFAVIDLATRTLIDIVPAGLKNHARGLPRVATYDFPELPVLGTTPAGQTLRLGGFSGLWFEGINPGNNALKFVTVPDRGPNAEPSNVDGDAALERPFALPDYQPRIVRFEFNPASHTIQLTGQILLTRTDGTTPMTGRPNIGNGVDEEGVDLNGQTLTLDPLGADIEGVAIAADGSYWMVDEYRPAIYHFATTGALLQRYVPSGTAALGGQSPGYYGTETLPAEYSLRRPNRGFEGVALDSDRNIVYAFIQTPLSNPNQAAGSASRVVRMLGIAPADGSVVAEYVYLMEKPVLREQNTDKIGDAAYAGNGRFVIVERDDSVQRSGKKMLFEFDLTGATNLRAPGAPALLPGLSLEQHTPDQLRQAGIRAVNKLKVANLPSIGYFQGDKLEGVAALPDGRIALLNDNDFGIAAQPLPSPPNGSVPMEAEPTPIQLGLLSFDRGGTALDASDRDGPGNTAAINVTNWPVYGMHMPDSIAAFRINGETFYASAGEGDDRGETARVSTLNLDATAFPNATALKTNAQIGRLTVSTIDGDVDGDGDYDRLQVLGSRSFAIWDRYSNLVFDSGDSIERLIARLNPADFNADNEANQSRDTRSDNKGPEPEALAVGQVGTRTYAFVGLERVGGIVAFDITDPYAPSVAGYVNRRDFSVVVNLTQNPAAAGDLGPEGIAFISAADSPSGEALIAVANEISGTATLFRISEILFRDGFEVQ